MTLTGSSAWTAPVWQRDCAVITSTTARILAMNRTASSVRCCLVNKFLSVGKFTCLLFIHRL